MNKWIKSCLICLCFYSATLQADSELQADPELRVDRDWYSFTMDNDLFVADDSGYSNGFYFSWVNVNQNGQPGTPPILVWPLLWSLDLKPNWVTVKSSTIGQVINTPSDITVENPDPRELPYSGLLFYNSTYLSIHHDYADKLSTSIGVLGPLSGAEEVQDFVHSLTGSDDPQGWDTQLENELVFEFNRGRIYRSWVSETNDYDLLINTEASLGTISSMLAAGVVFRYGAELERSFATHLLNSTRISNPVAVNEGWYFYSELWVSYLFNIIFADGNTFRDSRSIDYDPQSLGLGFGFSYSWGDASLTFAINDSSIIEDESEEQVSDLTRFGTLTFAWRQ